MTYLSAGDPEIAPPETPGPEIQPAETPAEAPDVTPGPSPSAPEIQPAEAPAEMPPLPGGAASADAGPSATSL